MVSTNPDFIEKIATSVCTFLFFHFLITFDLLHTEVGNAAFSEYNYCTLGLARFLIRLLQNRTKIPVDYIFAGTSSSEESFVGETLLSDGRWRNDISVGCAFLSSARVTNEVVRESEGQNTPPSVLDKAHFWLNGYVNKQNCRIWSEANPQVYVETPLHPEKLTVWCALWAGGILLQKRGRPQRYSQW
ncbi:hypothetical protein TNCV_405881 [Trichonephila clavipes]|nr:hypothetical protein TNCV_405881 [Trichonephila clavipes]